jgi:hypothetical protein
MTRKTTSTPVKGAASSQLFRLARRMGPHDEIALSPVAGREVQV